MGRSRGQRQGRTSAAWPPGQGTDQIVFLFYGRSHCFYNLKLYSLQKRVRALECTSKHYYVQFHIETFFGACRSKAGMYLRMGGCFQGTVTCVQAWPDVVRVPPDRACCAPPAPPGKGWPPALLLQQWPSAASRLGEQCSTWSVHWCTEHYLG